jgi:ubiquitin carboxyl-terminal hydrolase 8
VFGGPSQQDAQEFYSFILANLHDETNMRRDVLPPRGVKQYSSADGTVVQNAMDAWNTYRQHSNSIIDRYFRGLDVFVIRCVNPKCRLEQRTFQPSEMCILPVGALKDRNPIELVDLLDTAHAPETIDGSTCERCKTNNRQHEHHFARLPDRLAFCLSRFQDATSPKLANKVRFPIRNLDLTSYMAEPDPVGKATPDRHYAGRMLYDCYAVTVHLGADITGGHYISYVQDEQSRDPSDWWKCDDEWVERVKIGSGAPGDGKEAMYRSKAASAYMVYYRRQGT